MSNPQIEAYVSYISEPSPIVSKIFPTVGLNSSLHIGTQYFVAPGDISKTNLFSDVGPMSDTVGVGISGRNITVCYKKKDIGFTIIIIK